MINVKSLAQDVEKYVHLRLAHYIQELKELCAIDSDSFHKEGLDEMARRMAARMKTLGMAVTIFEHDDVGNDVFGVMSGEGEGKVLLLGHIDTVYPVGTAKERPLRVEGDTVYGPGVSDMKGCILAAMYALEALWSMNYRAFGEIRFLCVSDEEINMRHSRELLGQASKDCEGVLVLEAARANGDIVCARKGVAWYTLTARGHAAHAGVEPEKGHNAIVELAHQILQFQSVNGWREGLSINSGLIRGGTAPNVVPDFAEVTFDLRYGKRRDRLDTEARWRRMMEDRLVSDMQLTLEMAPDCRDPLERTPEGMRLCALAQDIAADLGFRMNCVATGGGSDANYVAGYGVPVLDGLGPIGGLDHSPDEYLVASSVAPRAALLAGLISAIGSVTRH